MTGLSRSTITPHASHTMTRLAGEPCCAVCYAAPWMPLIEQPCSACDMSPVAREKAIAGELDVDESPRLKDLVPDAELRDAALERALELRAEGKTWREVADALGVPSARALSWAARRYQTARDVAELAEDAHA